MTRHNSSRLLTPPREEEEVHPYRRVWPSIAIEVGLLFGLVFVFFVIVNFLGVSIPADFRRPINVVLAVSPALLWLIFSQWREQLVPEPRRNQLSVFVVSALAANAVGLPLINALEVEQWLSLADTFDRIIGYTVTVGIVSELLKYLVIRYIVWPHALRIRLDALAYATASAMGYALVANLHLVLATSPAPDVTALHVFANTAFHLAASAVVAYGIAEVLFNPGAFLIMPFALMLAALIHGIAIPFRSGLVNANFALGISSTRPLVGLLFSLAAMVGTFLVVAFLFNTSERQEREAAASREV